MNILITGASGLIGMAAVRRLSQRHRVYALVRHLPSGSRATPVCWLQGDLTNPSVTDRLPTHLDVIIHLAQSRRFRDFPESATDIFDVNVASTLRLLNYARQVGVRQFILASSGGIYGQGPQPFTESDPPESPDRLSFYLTTKILAEELLAPYAPFFVTTVLRPFFIYGKAQSSQMLIPRLIRRVQTGQPIQLTGESGLRLNPIYVLDVVEVLERCLDLQTSCAINVAGSDILTLRQMGEIIGAVVGKPARFSTEVGRPNDLVGDIKKMKQLLHYRPQVSFQQGIAHACQ